MNDTADILRATYTLEVEGLQVPGTIEVEEFEFRSSLAGSYSLQLRALMPIPPGEHIEPSLLARRGDNVTLTMEYPGLPETLERIHGIVLSVTREIGDPDPQVSRKAVPFELTIGPAFELLRFHRGRPQTWHSRSYSEVLTEVLDKELAVHGRTVVNKTQPGRAIDLITRVPDEDVLAFIKRLLDESGTNAFFDFPPAGPEVLVLGDENGHFIEGKRERKDPIPVSQNISASRTELVLEASGTADLFAGAVHYQGFEAVKNPSVLISERAIIDEGLPPDAEEVYFGTIPPAHEAGEPEAPHAEAVIRQQERSSSVRFSITVTTAMLGMLPGRFFELALHPDDIRTFVVDDVTITLAGHGEFRAKAELVPFTRFDGQQLRVRAMDEPTRMRRPGVTLARVEAIDHPSVDVDAKMWCRLRFLWDDADIYRTTRIAMVQTMGGSFGGTQWIPRKGDLVVVAFAEGNPDLPIIVGCLYDEKDHPPPFLGPPQTPGFMNSQGTSQTLPDSALWLGWNHNSVTAGAEPSPNYTMVAMHVAEDKELFFSNAPKDWRLDIKNHSDTWIKEGNVTHTIDTGDLTETLGKGNYVQRIETGSRDEFVKSDYTLKVEGNGDFDITGGSTSTVTGAVKSTCKAGVLTTIEQGNTEQVMSGDRVMRCPEGSILMSAGPAIRGNARTIDFDTSSGSSANEGSGLSIASVTKLRGLNGAQLSSGPSKIEADAKGVTVKGPAAHVEDQGGGSAALSNGNYTLQCPQGITLRCGPTELRLTPQGVFINGQQLSLTAGRTDLHTGKFNIVHPDGSDVPDPD